MFNDNNTNNLPNISRKPNVTFPKSVTDEMDRLSTKITEKPQLFGSFLYRYQKYPGDIDLIEKVAGASQEAVIKNFINKLKIIVKSISNTPNHYFSDFKCGLDKRYMFKIGYMENGYYYVESTLLSKINDLKNKNLLDKEDYDLLMKILNTTSILNSDAFDTVIEILRKYYLLRWSVQEILSGKKKLRGNISMTLQEALHYKTLVKIDEIVQINHRFVEVTNIYNLMTTKVNKKGDPIDVSANYESPIMTADIEKYYYSNKYYSPFKMMKRAYSLCRHYYFEEKDEKYLDYIDKFLTLLSGNISLLYQIYSEYDTIITLMEKYQNKPLKLINMQLNESKNRLSYVTELPGSRISYYAGVIDRICNSPSLEYRIKLLTALKKDIFKIINYYSIDYMTNIDFNPPPASVLPSIGTIRYDTPLDELLTKKVVRTYDRNIFRSANSDPPKMYEIYLDHVEKGMFIPPYKDTNSQERSQIDLKDQILKSGGYF